MIIKKLCKAINMNNSVSDSESKMKSGRSLYVLMWCTLAFISKFSRVKRKKINEANCNYSLINIGRLISNGEGKDDVLRVFLKEDDTFPT